MDYFDSNTPSIHDLLTGYWTPTEEEKKAGLETGFLKVPGLASPCTIFALLKY
jgi:hypothetical protein